MVDAAKFVFGRISRLKEDTAAARLDMLRSASFTLLVASCV